MKTRSDGGVRRENTLRLAVMFFGASLLAGACFIALEKAIFAGHLQSFDEHFLFYLRNEADIALGIGPAWLQETLIEITGLGGYPVVILILISTVSLFLIISRADLARDSFLAIGLGWLISHFLKQYYDRPRPDLVPYFDKIHTASFPSGHSMMSMVLYLTLAGIIVRCFDNPRVKVFAICLALFLTGIVGISRVYLGVHWPSDVLAGWLLGLAWVCFIWALIMANQVLQQRKPPMPE